MSRITTDQVAEILAQDKAGRVTRENLQAFLRNPQCVNYKPSNYTVSVDYDKRMEEMVKAGHYDWSYDNINDNFKSNGTGVVVVDLEIVHPDNAVKSEDVLAYLEENGLRPANSAELLAFGATYPEIQLESPIVGLGSSWIDPSNTRNVLVLSGFGSERFLLFNGFGSDWSDYCRFLAVRKSA